jgi:hypothetical protein
MSRGFTDWDGVRYKDSLGGNVEYVRRSGDVGEGRERVVSVAIK